MKSNFERKKQSCPFRHFDECLCGPASAQLKRHCTELTCPKSQAGAQQADLLKSCMKKLDTSQIQLLHALFTAVSPDVDDRRAWSEKAQSIIVDELKSRDPA